MRVAQQIGIILILSFVGIYVIGEFNLIDLGITSNLLVIAVILLVVDLLLLMSPGPHSG